MTYGILSLEYCKKHLPLEALQSAAGWYIGTFDYSTENFGPCSRESYQYFPTKEDAEKALATGMWTQRSHP